MDMQNKLDEDFLFYLGFTNKFSKNLKECNDKMLAQHWLQRLCGEAFATVDQKRNRNIFLSNLLLNLQEAKLQDPFTKQPHEVDLMDPGRWFDTIAQDIQAPEWLEEVVGDDEGDTGGRRDDGRTYVATRAMPGGEGAFAYVAVSLAEDEPKWLGGGEGVFDREMARKYQDMVPPQYEMEQILARRKDPRERQRVLAFYDVMLQNISDELDEKITACQNNAITVILEQLVADLKAKGQWQHYESLEDKERRIELLLVLFDKTKSRRDKTAKREEILDNVDATFRQSFFENTTIGDEDRYELPAAMWEYAMNRPPHKKLLNQLQIMYPPFIVEKFLELMSNNKEEIAVRMHKRHSKIVAQMKKDLRKEGDKLKRWVEEAKLQCDQAVDVLKDVERTAKLQADSYKRAAQRTKGGETTLTALYNEIKATLAATQEQVEEEAARGRLLTEQINNISAQSDMFKQVTECSIIKTEEANIALMKNVRKLQHAVTQHETRLAQITNMHDTMVTSTAKAGQSMLIM